MNYRRKYYRDQPVALTDVEIAQRIKELAEDGVDGGAKELTPQQVLAAMLVEQREQTVLLKRMSWVIQLFGVLLILGIIGGYLVVTFGASLH